MYPLISMAFMTGLLSSAHCIGMCGGLVSALSLTADGRNSGLLFHLLYNLGRTLTYALIGFLVGWLGSMLALKSSLQDVTRMLLVGSDLFVILIGLGSAGLFTKINILTLEFSGPISAMSNMVKGLRKLPSALSALPLGLMFGFLPCGMVYAMALTAVQSADQVTGALMMAAYGLGTAPVLFLVGGTAQWISSKRRWMLKAAGVMVAIMGSYNLYVHIRMLG